MEKVKEFWKNANGPFKAIVITMGVAVAIKVVLWLVDIGVITNVVK